MSETSELRSHEDIDLIVQAGGGLILNARWHFTDHLVRWSSMAASSGATLILKDTGNIETSELVRICKAGKGRVIIEVMVSSQESKR